MALWNAKMDRFKIRKVHGMWPQLFIQQSLNKCLSCRRHCTGYKNKTILPCPKRMYLNREKSSIFT